MRPRFKLDENLPTDAEALLRADGFDVETALTERLGGATHAVILDACRREGRVLVSLDLDFADIREFPPLGNLGIWVLRPSRQTVQNILELLRGAMRFAAIEEPEGHLWVVESDRIRIRL